tara:strand:+ start:97 stop:483 length:387 start_codon:yes stop_codon:yes gene_type:complete
MNRSLRKTAASVSVTYSHGHFSNDLTGTEFELELSEKDICLSINLWGNLSVRNKSANCYSDACELAEDHALLKSVQIDDSQMIDGFLNAHQKAPSTCWKVKLLLGAKGTFDYSVKPEMANGSVFLNVC